MVPLRLLRSLLVPLLLLALLQPPILAAPKAQPVPQGRITYVFQNRLWLYDLATGARRSLDETGEIRDPQWSPSGAYLSFRIGDQTIIRTISGPIEGPLRRILPSAPIAWAPRAEEFAYWPAEDRLQIESATGSVRQAIPTAPKATSEAPLWRPDGRMIAWVEGNGSPQARVMGAEVSTGSAKPLYTTPVGDPNSCLTLAAWQTNDRLLLWPQQPCSASIAADGVELHALEIGTGALQPLTLTENGVSRPVITLFQPIAVTRSGRAAIAEGIGRISTTEKRIVVIEPDGQGTAPVSPERQAAIQPAWAPDGQRLAWTGSPDYGADDWQKGLWERRIWVAPRPRPVTTFWRGQDQFPLWTADGGHLLFVRLDRQKRASLWLLRLQNRAPSKIADLDTGGLIDYYGRWEWQQVFAYSPR